MKKSQVIKSIVYVLILVLLFYWASGVLVAKWRDHNCETDMMREFYRTEKNSVDVLILGSSQVVAGFSPMEMYEKHGISAYSLGSSNQPLFCSYYLLREALERQNISNLVIDVSMLYVRGDRESVRKILDNMPLSKNKLVAIRDQRDMKIAEDQKSLVLPIMKYHTRWKELVAEDFIYEERDKIQYRGGVMMSGLTELNIEGFYIDDDEITEESMYDYELEYFEKILDLCEEKNIDVLLCKTPKSYWNLTKHNEVQEIADARGLDFIDFNLKSNLDAIGFDMTQDMKDKEHANLRGAVKMSDYVGQYLVDHYDLKDHRDTGLFTQEYLDTYHRKYEDTYMVSNGDVADYFQYFDNERYEILITGDGTLGASWTDEMQQALAQYGVVSDIRNLNGQYYVAHLVAGQSIYEQAKEESITYSSSFGDGQEFTLELEDKLKITVGEEEYTGASNRVNIFVYDTSDSSLVDEAKIYYNGTLGCLRVSHDYVLD